MTKFSSSLPVPPAPLHTEALEGRVALRLTAQLHLAAEALPHDITERLRFGRERALAAARQQRSAAVVLPQLVGVGGRTASLGGPPSLWLRLVSALPLVVLLAGLALIQDHYDAQQISAAAEIDSALLADELPPTAYGDPGFSEFLRSPDAP